MILIQIWVNIVTDTWYKDERLMPSSSKLYISYEILLFISIILLTHFNYTYAQIALVNSGVKTEAFLSFAFL